MPDTLNARCTALGCGHVWAVAHLPMDLSTVGDLCVNARCPKCGGARPVLAGPTMDEGETQHA